eukprot:gnl/Hemi2/147_TR38_c0_g1_i1.p1 gnl/Hemi2/147_TR38_c0_g1~~gnl/Hemi2/147_TR38_c0_g1_i1.p1  ORF type:complete len:204 (-),score=47.03 gnl/Hemi2/147_TR38_c0_g1_i1:333-857(-)
MLRFCLSSRICNSCLLSRRFASAAKVKQADNTATTFTNWRQDLQRNKETYLRTYRMHSKQKDLEAAFNLAHAELRANDAAACSEFAAKMRTQLRENWKDEAIKTYELLLHKGLRPSEEVFALAIEAFAREATAKSGERALAIYNHRKRLLAADKTEIMQRLEDLMYSMQSSRIQ